MAQIELLMPKMGESVAEATIIKWLKEEGDQIEAEESVLEIATDKVDSEIPAPEDGVLVKKLFNEGDVVAVGQPIAIISTDGEAVAETPETPAQENIQPAAANDTAQTAVAAPQTSEKIAKTSESGRFYSPLVRSIAEKEGISAQELETIPGTGQGGRVTKKDILAYLENRKNQPATAPQPAQTATNGSSAATAHAAPAKQQK